MPLFSRSSERKSLRLSLRKHLHHDIDTNVDAVSRINSGHTIQAGKKPRRQTQLGRVTEQTMVVPSTTGTINIGSRQVPPPKLSISVGSSASTLRSTTPILHENVSCRENDTEISEISEVSEESENQEPAVAALQSRVLSARSSRHSSSSGFSSSCSSRKSLAEYRQLHCSMSYKNRVNSDAYRATRSTSSSSESRMSDRMSDMRTSLVEGFRSTNTSFRSSSGQSLLNARISESSTAITPVDPSLVSPLSPAARFSDRSTSSASSRMTEVGVAVMQTRRALQQMVLAIEDDDSGDEYESDSDVLRKSSVDSSQGSSGVVRLGADEYRKFQFRLRQLEEVAAEQSKKQENMEQTIEMEVQARTATVIKAMEKQISMYKQAKELEFECEVQKRVSELLQNPRLSLKARRNSIPLRSSAAYASSNVNFHESYRLLSNSIKEEGNSLGKLLHPRRSRKRLELLKQREEAQKREMEQFREFIRTTEMRITTAQNTDTLMSAAEQMKAKSVLVELADPLLPESLVHLSPLELIQLICILRKSGREQEMQLEEAKNLVSAAIEAREDAEATAREAVELMAVLDSKLDRAVHEEQKLVQKLSVAGELRHSSELGDASGRSSTLQVGTPASPGAIE